jgi:hypothetical protein
MFLKQFKDKLLFRKRHSYQYLTIGMFFYLGTFSLFAQESTLQLPGTDLQSHWKLDLSIGTTGLGLGVSFKPIETPWIFRARYNYLAGGLDFGIPVGVKKGIMIQPTLHIHADTKMSHFSLMADYFLLPSEKLKITFGVAFHPNKNLSVQASLRDFRYHDVVYTPTELGMVTANWHYKNKLSPYVGVGLGRSIPKKRFRVSVEAGVYYMGDWQFDDFKVTEGIILDRWTPEEKDFLKSTVKDRVNARTEHKLLPNLNLMFHFLLY